MGLKDKLKFISQKTVQAAALTAGLSAGISAAEARAETTEKADSASPTSTLIADNSNDAPKVNAMLRWSKTDYVKTDMIKVMQSLDLIDSEGNFTFTYHDLLKAQKQDSIDGSSDTPKSSLYTEYEQKIINEAAVYLSSDLFSVGGKEAIKKRIYQVLEASGNPKISYIKDENSLTAHLVGHTRSNYSPGGRGHIYINDSSDFIPELAHAFRQKNNVIGEAGNFIMDGLKDIFTLSSVGFSSNAQAQNYEKTGYMEHDAHSIVEPVLKQYIMQKSISEYGDIKSVSEVAAMIDILRHQQNDRSAVYTWTSDGDKAVARGKEILRNRYLSLFARDDNLTDKLAREAGMHPLLKDIFWAEQQTSSCADIQEANTDSKKLSPTLIAVAQNNRSNS